MLVVSKSGNDTPVKRGMQDEDETVRGLLSLHQAANDVKKALCTYSAVKIPRRSSMCSDLYGRTAINDVLNLSPVRAWANS
ncbi:hypothetical protein MesoLjLc_31220 [Mesorhizobium sp. L-8-10]|nr:hypothetical protein MesoLjLc_31220 [Mesorhizobium sp. L-8-10]